MRGRGVLNIMVKLMLDRVFNLGTVVAFWVKESLFWAGMSTTISLLLSCTACLFYSHGKTQSNPSCQVCIYIQYLYIHVYLENSPKKICTLIGKKKCFYLNRNRTSMSSWHNDGASEENLHFDDQSKQVVPLFFVLVFSKRNRKHVLCVSIELLKHLWKFGSSFS